MAQRARNFETPVAQIEALSAAEVSRVGAETGWKASVIDLAMFERSWVDLGLTLGRVDQSSMRARAVRKHSTTMMMLSGKRYKL